MKKTLVGSTLLMAGLALASAPALAQRVYVDVAWRSNQGVRIAASYSSPAAYMRLGYRRCEPDGPYVYCWDTRAYRPGAAVAIHVFRNQSYRNARDYRRAVRRANRMERKAYEQHMKAARKAWQRWHRQHRSVVTVGYGGAGRRVIVDGPEIGLRLSFHL
jgi:hypothetical protein